MSGIFIFEKKKQFGRVNYEFGWFLKAKQHVHVIICFLNGLLCKRFSPNAECVNKIFEPFLFKSFCQIFFLVFWFLAGGNGCIF